MNHQTWEIPQERRRGQFAQTLAELRHSLLLLWHYLIGPFWPAPRPLTDGAKSGAPVVVIVPGFICRPALYVDLQRAIHAAGYPCHILDLGFQLGSIEPKGRELSDYLTRIGAKEALVIGHSMGGLILASCLVQGETRVRAGWLLGAPVFGTTIIYAVYGLAALAVLDHWQAGFSAWLAAAAVFFVPALRQMLPRSRFIAGLAARYPQMTQLTSVFCQLDLIAFHNPLNEPGTASRFGRETDVLFPEAGHNNLAMGDNAIAAVVAALTRT